MNKNEHLLRFHRFQRSREKHFAPLINTALNTQYKQFTSQLPYKGLMALENITPTPIIKVLRNLYMDAGIVYGAKIRADLNKQGLVGLKEFKNRRAIGFSEEMAKLIAEYFRADILKQSEGITETTRKLIQEVFTKAYVEGLGINDIIKQLEDTELSKIRSRLIARTETVTAANQGALFVAKSTGLQLNKIWLSAHDNRVRNDHRLVDGHTVARDEYFMVGGEEMLVPGDRGGHDGKPLVSPENICNCRCTTLFQSVRDSNGRLILVA